MKKKTPLFLFPGLVCTERLFAMQKDGLSDSLDVIVPEWLQPHSQYDLNTYALLWGEKLWNTYFAPEVPEEERYDATKGCLVGGMSFGGMVAPIIGRFLASKGVPVHLCFRIATFRYGDEIPWRFRMYWRLMNIFPDGCWFTIGSFCRTYLALGGKKVAWARREVYQQVIDTPCRRAFHVVRMIYTWRGPSQEFAFPILHVHGGKDSLLPMKYTKPDIVIPKGGHCLPLTFGRRLNDIILNEVREKAPQCLLQSEETV